MAMLAQINTLASRVKKFRYDKKSWSRFGKSAFWFALGGFLGFFFFISFVYIIYQKTHTDKVYQGVIVNGVNFGGKTQEEVRRYFAEKNKNVEQTTFTLTSPQASATVSAKEIGYGYDADLLAKQAISIGRSEDLLSNMSIIAQAYINNIALPPAYTYSEEKLDKIITPLKQKTDIQPVDPLFNFENNKVVAFRMGKDGQVVDKDETKNQVLSQFRSAIEIDTPRDMTLAVPIRRQPSAVAEEKADKLGIKEAVGTGTSQFQGSIENRIFNISLAATRLNGTLIKPGEVFSFNKAVGDISVFTGYKQALVIQNGKTVPGDGGGVCQVSTTLFRAALDAGLPIVERNPHAYRVGYYEQNSGPGIDAAIYTPTLDLKFKNDTDKHLLIQTYIDVPNRKLSFTLFGTKDNRKVSIGKPVVLSQTPPPEPSYQDDPNLPKGEVKQVESAAAGAKVYFTRTVEKDGKTVLNDRFTSNYRPWQAVYMRGTKE